MTICFGKSCSFGLLCMFSWTLINLLRASFLFGFVGGIWDLIVLIPDHCLSIYLFLFCIFNYSSFSIKKT